MMTLSRRICPNSLNRVPVRPVAAVLLAACLGLSTVCIAGELLVNGGAETGTLDGWVRSPANAPIVAASQVTQTSGIVSQSGLLPRDEHHLRLTGRYQTEFGDSGEAILRFLDVNPAVLDEASTGAIDDADLQWKQFVVVAAVPARATSWEVELRGTLVAGQFINVFYDDLHLTEGCLADLDGDGAVAGSDLGILLGGWGQPGISDVDGNGTTDAADLAIQLGAWGPGPA